MSDLAERAGTVLEHNWLGHATRPGPRLYPHQWSWDSALIAIGWAHVAPDRALTELRSLFAAQWPNGMVPHIVFQDDASPYFPGPDVWRALVPRTTGIVQPPVHASAIWRAFRATGERAFLEDLYEPLCRWHEYLVRDRDPDGDGLASIRHPWESGQDDSPAWDAALAAIPLDPDVNPPYRRVDLTMVSADERPSPAEYDHYVALVECFKAQRYDERAMRRECPFWVDGPMFNALLSRAEEDLGRIADALGVDGTEHRRRSAHVAAAINERLWDDQAGLYFARDRRRGAALPARVSACFTPLLTAAPDPERAARLVQVLTGKGFWGDGLGVTSYDRRSVGFSRRRYWRGPIWVNVNWLLCEGLRRHGYEAEAAHLRDVSLELVDREGFAEYFDPVSGQGRGEGSFSWTAALVLDWLAEEGT